MDRRQAAKEYETTDPSQACLFFPPVNTLCSHNRCSPVSLIQNMRLRALPYWNSGRNHILFDTSDHEEAQLTPSHAIVVRSNFLQWSYRHGFDVSGPLEQHDSRPHTIGQGVRWRDAHSNWPKERESHQVRPVINRTWHVFLRSSCTHPIRLELARLLHDVRLKRIVLVSDKFMTGVATSCTGMAARPAGLEIYRQYAKTTTQYQHEMMSDSVFGLVPPGTGEHSMSEATGSHGSRSHSNHRPGGACITVCGSDTMGRYKPRREIQRDFKYPAACGRTDAQADQVDGDAKKRTGSVLPILPFPGVALPLRVLNGVSTRTQNPGHGE